MDSPSLFLHLKSSYDLKLLFCIDAVTVWQAGRLKAAGETEELVVKQFLLKKLIINNKRIGRVICCSDLSKNSPYDLINKPYIDQCKVHHTSPIV